MDQPKGCEFKNKTYAHGEQVCIADKCMICTDGAWQYSFISESGAED